MQSEILNYKNEQWDGLSNFSFPKPEVQLILCFADRALLETSTLYDTLKNEFANAHILTCSTAGEISGRNVENNSAVIMAIKFDKTTCGFSKGNIKNKKNSFDLGSNTANLLLKDELKYVLVLSDGNLVNGDELIDGIQSVLDPAVIVSGGVAGDGDRFQKTLVGLDADICEGNVVLLGLYGNHIRVGTNYQGGWDVFGPEKIITKSTGNILYEIDYENALDLYKKYLGKYASELPGSALLFPLSIKSENSNNFIVRTILSIDEKNKSMTFAGNLPQGSTVRFMKSNSDRLVLAASEAGTKATANLENDVKAELAIVVSCVGRKIVLSDRIGEEVDAAIDNISDAAKIAGFFSYGEIAPQDKDHRSYLHNQTITITTLAELP